MWRLLLAAILLEKSAAYVVAVNEYSGSLDKPGFELARRSLRRDALSGEVLRVLPPAELLVIK
jgi:hypothetical protein